jgi:hypothetical protein
MPDQSSIDFQLVKSRLLQGGIAKRYAERAVREWQDHLQDLQHFESAQSNDSIPSRRNPMTAIGDIELLIQEMLQRVELKTWTWRHSALWFSLGPLGTMIVSILLLSLLALAAGSVAEIGPSASVPMPSWFFFTIQLLVGFLVYGLSPAIVAAYCALARRRHAPLLWPLVGVFLVAVVGSGWDYTVTAPSEFGTGSLSLAWGWPLLGMQLDAQHNTQTAMKLILCALNTVAILTWYKPDTVAGFMPPR